MQLIDSTYFKNDMRVPNLALSEANALKLEEAITDYEPVFLTGVLGPSVYVLFVAAVEAANATGFSSMFSAMFQHTGLTGRWAMLRDGALFTLNGRSYQWKGLITSGKRSPIADFVWHRMQENTVTINTNNGQAKAKKGEKVESTDPRPKMERVWLRMMEWNRELYDFLMYAHDESGSLLFPEFEPHQLDEDLFYGRNAFGI